MLQEKISVQFILNIFLIPFFTFKVWSVGTGFGFGVYLVIGLFFQLLKRAPLWGHVMAEGKFGVVTAGAVIMYFHRR